MARSDAAPIELASTTGLAPGVGYQTIGWAEGLQGGVVTATDLRAGMVTSLPREQRGVNSFAYVLNGRMREGWVGTREGTLELGTKPDSNPVRKLFGFVDKELSFKLCRITESSFHVWNGSSWRGFTINDGGFSASERWSVAQLFGKVYLANGVDPLWEVDFTSEEINQVPDSPRAKFVATFAGRLVTGNLLESTRQPAKLKWCARLEPHDWTGTGSGEENLVETDLGNEINGLVALGNQLVVLRRISIEHLTQQPFAIAPFRFTTILQGTGCDLPFSAVRVPGGVMYGSLQERAVMLYSPGSRPQRLSDHVQDTIFPATISSTEVDAAYDFSWGEYHLGFQGASEPGNFAEAWVVNRSGAWAKDDGPNVSAMGAEILPSDGTTIDELAGTIDALVGSIDRLSPATGTRVSLVQGTETGEVIYGSYTTPTDWDGSEFTFELRSQNLGSISQRRTLKDLEVTIVTPVGCDVSLAHSVDEETWRNSKTTTFTGDSVLQRIRLPKTQTTGDDLWWRLQSSGQVRVFSWWARIMEKGLQAGGQQ